jgi:hypothetical protein
VAVHVVVGDEIATVLCHVGGEFRFWTACKGVETARLCAMHVHAH